jgi:Protein of unknown function DUF262
MDNPRPENVTPAGVIQWRDANCLDISPKFQRRDVWSTAQRSYFIDTLLREFPCPPLYLRNVYKVRERKIIHEVIDGQQRLRAVLAFIDGDFSLSKTLDATYRGHRFADLSLSAICAAVLPLRTGRRH